MARIALDPERMNPMPYDTSDLLGPNSPIYNEILSQDEWLEDAELDLFLEEEEEV
jgi:uncharacterized protein YukJ